MLGKGRVHDHYSATLSELDSLIVRSVPPGGNWKDLPSDLPSKRVSQIRRSYRAGKGSRSTYYGRLRWDRPSYTINTYFNRPGNGTFIHPQADRLITLREAARLQSFPDYYRFSGTMRDRCQQIGNAVPPLLAYHIGSTIPPGTFVDLFCGAGGLSLGLEFAGFQTILATDNNPASLDAYARNRDESSACQLIDLASRTGVQQVVTEIKKRLGVTSPHLIVGGPPCQGFSTAGNCQLDDPRNDLVQAFLAVVEETLPEFVLLENVAALLWRRNEHVVQALRHRLSEFGYVSNLMIGHAESYGVPQLRRRAFVLAARSLTTLAWPTPSFKLSEPAQRRFQPAADAGRLPPVTVQQAIGDLPHAVVIDPESLSLPLAPPQSDFQRWVRGECDLREFLPPISRSFSEPQLALSMAE